jgi:APA family basic amino acid/polyamine antiporter
MLRFDPTGGHDKVTLTRQLNTFDVTSLVVGSIIGADIYVAAALGARLVGPFSLVIWCIAGIMAIVIALSFSYCATIMPKTGGPYAYVKATFGTFPGFLVGWALLLAEWFSLVVFPVAFVTYFLTLFPQLSQNMQILLKGVFVIIIFLTNTVGIKRASKFNDVLTIAKLSPLVLFIIIGAVFVVLKPEVVSSNLVPFLKGDIHNFGQALVLIFWAYAGFELSTLPADEIREPGKTLPRAIFMGMLIVMVFYIITNFVIVGAVNQATLTSSTAPLVTAANRIVVLGPLFASIFGFIIVLGALVSIMGADESGTIGTSRLVFALSIDGLLPHVFAKLHKSFRTPYVSLGAICVTAFVASVAGSLKSLINASVFLLSFTYLATCITTIFMIQRHPDKATRFRSKRVVPILGIIFAGFLMTQVGVKQILISLLLMAVGFPIYVFFSPGYELADAKNIFLSRDAILVRAYHQGHRFLAFPLRMLKWLVYRMLNIEKAWLFRGDS